MLAFLKDALAHVQGNWLVGTGSGGSGAFSTFTAGPLEAAQTNGKAVEATSSSVPGLRCEALEDGGNFCVRAAVEVGAPGNWARSCYAVALNVPCARRGQALLASTALAIRQEDDSSDPAQATYRTNGHFSPTHVVTTTTKTVKLEPWLLRKRITVKTTVREVLRPNPSAAVGSGSGGSGGSGGGPLEEAFGGSPGSPLKALQLLSPFGSSNSSNNNNNNNGNNGSSRRGMLPSLPQEQPERALLNTADRAVPDEVAAVFRKYASFWDGASLWASPIIIFVRP
jgi:hypothetical protein